MLATTRLRTRTRLGATPAVIRGPELVREFEKMIFDCGSHVLYIRRLKNVHHECWVTQSQQSAGLQVCPECYGTGHVLSIERHLARDWDESSPGRESMSYTRVDPGVLENPAHSFTFKPIVNAQEGDLIFRVEWNAVTQRPINLIQAFEIHRVVDKREEMGYLVYYKCFCQSWSVNTAEIANLIRRETRIRVVD